MLMRFRGQTDAYQQDHGICSQEMICQLARETLAITCREAATTVRVIPMATVWASESKLLVEGR